MFDVTGVVPFESSFNKTKKAVLNQVMWQGHDEFRFNDASTHEGHLRHVARYNI